MDLSQNFSYQDAIKGLGDLSRAAASAQQRFQKDIPKSKRQPFDPSGYEGLASNVSSYRPQNAPSNVSAGYDLGVVTTPYGGNTRYEKFHPGIDIANEIGKPIPAFTEGVVTEVYSGGKPRSGKGYGNYVIVTDKYGNKHRYSHLTRSYVQVGQRVGRGNTIGEFGNTGASYSTSGGTGSHLDYRVKDIYDKYIRPEKFIYGT